MRGLLGPPKEECSLNAGKPALEVHKRQRHDHQADHGHDDVGEQRVGEQRVGEQRVGEHRSAL